MKVIEAVPVASDIYERMELDAEGAGGSVSSDIEGLSLQEMDDYFGDVDPVLYL